MAGTWIGQVEQGRTEISDYEWVCRSEVCRGGEARGGERDGQKSSKRVHGGAGAGAGAGAASLPPSMPPHYFNMEGKVRGAGRGATLPAGGTDPLRNYEK